MPSDGVIILELAKPEISQPGGSSSRNIDHYECLVIRSESLGQLTGLAVKFIKKIS